MFIPDHQLPTLGPPKHKLKFSGKRSSWAGQDGESEPAADNSREALPQRPHTVLDTRSSKKKTKQRLWQNKRAKKRPSVSASPMRGSPTPPPVLTSPSTSPSTPLPPPLGTLVSLTPPSPRQVPIPATPDLLQFESSPDLLTSLSVCDSSSHAPDLLVLLPSFDAPGPQTLHVLDPTSEWSDLKGELLAVYQEEMVMNPQPTSSAQEGVNVAITTADGSSYHHDESFSAFGSDEGHADEFINYELHAYDNDDTQNTNEQERNLTLQPARTPPVANDLVDLGLNRAPYHPDDALLSAHHSAHTLGTQRTGYTTKTGRTSDNRTSDNPEAHPQELERQVANADPDGACTPEEDTPPRYSTPEPLGTPTFEGLASTAASAQLAFRVHTPTYVSPLLWTGSTRGSGFASANWRLGLLSPSAYAFPLVPTAITLSAAPPLPPSAATKTVNKAVSSAYAPAQGVNSIQLKGPSRYDKAAAGAAATLPPTIATIKRYEPWIGWTEDSALRQSLIDHINRKPRLKAHDPGDGMVIPPDALTPWISTSRDLTWVVWKISRRLWQGESAVEVAVVAFSLSIQSISRYLTAHTYQMLTSTTEGRALPGPGPELQEPAAAWGDGRSDAQPRPGAHVPPPKGAGDGRARSHDALGEGALRARDHGRQDVERDHVLRPHLQREHHRQHRVTHGDIPFELPLHFYRPGTRMGRSSYPPNHGAEDTATDRWLDALVWEPEDDYLTAVININRAFKNREREGKW